jgi:hypothetical protein
VAERYKGHQDIRWAYFKAANSISSDGEHHRVLSAVLKSDGGERGTLVDTLRSAARISSDDDKAAVLAEASRYYTDVDAIREAYFDAANTISSDDEHQKVLTELLHTPGLQPATLAGIAKSAQRISSDDEKAKVLSELAASDSGNTGLPTPCPNFLCSRGITHGLGRRCCDREFGQHSGFGL